MPDKRDKMSIIRSCLTIHETLTSYHSKTATSPRKVTSMYLTKALLGMLARLPWGRRNVLGLMNGKYEGVYVKYA